MASRLSKPLTAQSDDPFGVTTSARALNQQQANRSKRKARHDAAEANRAEGEKLMDRKVLTVTAKKVYTLDWIKRVQGVVRTFMEFTEEKLCASPNHPEQGAEYFKPQGLALNENIVRQFLLWHADTALGKISSMSWKPSATISSDRATVKSVEITA